MRMDDMILVSIDDHMIEPPDMYKNHLPAKYLDQAPKIVRNEQGVDEWTFQGQATSTPFGMAATVGWPREEWGFNPGSFSELRPGCFDVHERVRDMNANGVLGSMCFPTMAGFNARTFTEAGDKELSLVMLQAYNDWHIDEWCAAYPGRFIPLGIVPMWDVDLAVAEVHRIGKKGCRVDQLPRGAALAGLPELPLRPLGPDAPGDRRREHGAVPAHRRRARSHQAGARGADRPPDRALDPDHDARRAGPAVRPDAPEVPRAARRAVGGWHRVDPVLPRPGRPPLPEPGVDRQLLRRRQAAVRRVPRAHPRVLHHRPVGPRSCATASASTSSRGSATTPTPTPRGRSRPSTPGRSSRTPAAATRTSTRSRGRTPAGSSTGTRSSHTPKEQATVGALRALATDVDTTRMPRDEWRKQNEAAGIGLVPNA